MLIGISFKALGLMMSFMTKENTKWFKSDNCGFIWLISSLSNNRPTVVSSNDSKATLKKNQMLKIGEKTSEKLKNLVCTSTFKYLKYYLAKFSPTTLLSIGHFITYNIC